MSIVVTCNLSDGVIVGTDSAVTIQGEITTGEGKPTGGILKVYNHSEKLFQLEDLPICIASFGLGILGERTIGSYVKEFEFFIKKAKKTNKKYYKKLKNLSVEEITFLLREFFLEKYEEAMTVFLKKEQGAKYSEVPEEHKPLIGLVVAGISPNQYLSEIWQILIPIKDPNKAIIKIRERGSFGANWFGQIEPLTRLIKGSSNALPNSILDYLIRKHNISFDNNDRVQIKEIIKRFEYKIPYQAMPIQEGIAHVKYMLDVVIGQTRFVIGAPICGSPIRIGVIRRGETIFKFITDNALTVDPK